MMPAVKGERGRARLGTDNLPLKAACNASDFETILMSAHSRFNRTGASLVFSFSRLFLALLAVVALQGFASGEVVYEESRASIVEVISFLPGEESSSRQLSRGSGVVVRANTVITNCHVLAGGLYFNVAKGGRQTAGQILSVNLDADLCALYVPDLNQLEVIPARLSLSAPSVGSRVYAIGSPLGLEETLSEGVVSGIRTWDLVRLDFNRKVQVIQTSASIDFGSSGGGLFDSNARLVGITSFMFGRGSNLNFAVSVEEIEETLESAPRTGQDLHQRLNAIAEVVKALPMGSWRWTEARRKELWQERISVFSLAAAMDLPEFQDHSDSVENFEHRLIEVAASFLSAAESKSNHDLTEHPWADDAHALAESWALYARALGPSIPEPWIVLAKLARLEGSDADVPESLIREGFERRSAMRNHFYWEKLQRELCSNRMVDLARQLFEELEERGMRVTGAPCHPWELGAKLPSSGESSYAALDLRTDHENRGKPRA